MASSANHEIRDEDRLPWLETVDDDYRDGPSAARIGLIVLLGLCVVALAIIGLYLFNTMKPASKGDGTLIAALEGDYKVKPDTPGGMKVEGEGDTAFATSEGKGASNAAIDLKAMPEPPMAGIPAKNGKPVAKAGAAMVPTAKGKLSMPAPGALPAAAPAAAQVAGGSVVQLGSFPSEGAANIAWANASKRFGYLAPLGKSVQPALVNGSTVYRLRVNAGSASQATEICGKLKVAGEACFIARS